MPQSAPSAIPVPDISASIAPARPRPAPHKNIIIVLLVVLMISLVSIVYFVYRLHQPNRPIIPPPDKLSSLSAVSVNDEINDWETYTNPSQGIFFRYPASWILSATSNPSPKIAATIITLSQGEAVITFQLSLANNNYASKDLPGQAYVLDGHNLYKYTDDNPEERTKSVGISNTLTNSRGFFSLGNTRHSIVMTYANYLTPAEENKFLREFDLILSSVKFAKTPLIPSFPPSSNSS